MLSCPKPSFARLIALAVAALSPVPANAQRERVSPSSERNIVETLTESGRFTTLLSAIEVAGLSSTLEDSEALTFFAPSDRAFRRLPEGTLEALFAEPAALTALLSYHVVPGTLGSSDLEDGMLATLLSGSSLEIDTTRYWRHYIAIDVDDVSVRRKDITANNGVIHEIDAVLDPDFAPSPSLAEIIGAPEFSSFAALISQAGLDRILDLDYREFTVFAPTNAAFEEIPEADLEALINDRRALRKALLNHIVLRPTTSDDLFSQDSIRTAARLSLLVQSTDSVPPVFSVGSATLTQTDVQASNGLLHAIDAVLFPEIPLPIADLIAETQNLTTLSAALTASGFAETLGSTRSAPDFTIFAPSDAAFSDLPAETLAALLEDPTGALADVLGLHVVRGKITAERLRNGQTLQTISRDRLAVAISDDGEVTINGSPISQTDLLAANGVVHIIDAVIQDEPFTLADLVASKRYLSTVSAALDASGLATTLDDPSEEFTLLAPLDSAFRQ
ncbi:fasciclin domain-containing protein, partial [Verrucomicrobiales bacterium]|nr:fasciclin domain-containing protein [Verrucomicrobiales bacterium]